MNHPDCLPQYRMCAGTCGRSYALSGENFPTRKGEPNRYPWQPSYYRPRCHQCHLEYLAELRLRTKANRYAKEAERQRNKRAAVKQSLGMTWQAIKTSVAGYRAKKAEDLKRAARIAETRRALRGGRPYNPATDPFKRMIRDRQGQYLSKRLRRGPVGTVPREAPEQHATPEDFHHRLEKLRSRQAR